MSRVQQCTSLSVQPGRGGGYDIIVGFNGGAPGRMGNREFQLSDLAYFLQRMYRTSGVRPEIREASRDLYYQYCDPPPQRQQAPSGGPRQSGGSSRMFSDDGGAQESDPLPPQQGRAEFQQSFLNHFNGSPITAPNDLISAWSTAHGTNFGLPEGAEIDGSAAAPSGGGGTASFLAQFGK